MPLSNTSFRTLHPSSSLYLTYEKINIDQNVQNVFQTFSQLHASVSTIGPFYRPKWQISLRFHVVQGVKSLHFHIPEAWKRYPFSGEANLWGAIIGGTPPTLRQCFVAALTPVISPRYEVYPTPSVSIFFSFTRPLPTFGFVVVLSISFLQFHDQAAIQYPVNSMIVIVKRSMELYRQLAWPRWKWNYCNLAHF